MNKLDELIKTSKMATIAMEENLEDNAILDGWKRRFIKNYVFIIVIL